MADIIVEGCLHSTRVGNISWVHRALEQGVIVLELLERAVPGVPGPALC